MALLWHPDTCPDLPGCCIEIDRDGNLVGFVAMCATHRAQHEGNGGEPFVDRRHLQKGQPLETGHADLHARILKRNQDKNNATYEVSLETGIAHVAVPWAVDENDDIYIELKDMPARARCQAKFMERGLNVKFATATALQTIHDQRRARTVQRRLDEIQRG